MLWRISMFESVADYEICDFNKFQLQSYIWKLRNYSQSGGINIVSQVHPFKDKTNDPKVMEFLF